MKNVKFNEKGKWADPKDPRAPHVHVEAGSTHEVSDSLAEFVVDNDKGEYAKAPKPKKEKKKNAATDDKDKAEST